MSGAGTQDFRSGTFDLRGVSEPTPWLRKGVRVFVVVGIVFSTLLTTFAVLGGTFSRNGGFVPQDPFLTIVYAAATLVLVLVALVTLSPAATSIQISPWGLAITWPADLLSATRMEVPWTHLPGRSALEAITKPRSMWRSDALAYPPPPPSYNLNIRLARPIHLTPDARDAILAAAQSAGLRVRGFERTADGQTRLITRFEGPVSPN